MKIFAIGDTHLSTDPAVEKPMDMFGGEWVNHAEKLKKNWMDTVAHDDYVIIVGDISWALKLESAKHDLDWLRNLPGRKLFIKGNHDLWWSSKKKLDECYGKKEIYMDEFGIERERLIPAEDMRFIHNDAVIIGDVAVCGSRGWICPGSEGFTPQDEKIYRREVGRLRLSLEHAKSQGAEKIFCAIHYPPMNDKGHRSGFSELCEEFGVKICVYGHLHNKEGYKKGPMGVFNGVEYRLVSFDFIKGIPLRLY